MGIVLRTASLPGLGLASIISFLSANAVTGQRLAASGGYKDQITNLMKTGVISFVFLVT